MGFIAPEEQDIYDESRFSPKWTEEQTLRRLKAYYKVPHTFSDAQLEILSSHANHYGHQIQETPTTVKDDSIRIGRLLKKVGQGFLSGLTTFEVGDEPVNEAESIANSLGHLAGFVGYIPTAPLKALQATKLVGAAQALRGKSVPMLAATSVQKIVQPKVKQLMNQASELRNKAVVDAVNFVQKDIPKHMIEGGFHLGVASAVGSWQHGIDQMIASGAHGTIAGGAFRGIASLINKGGSPTLVKTVTKDHMGRPKPAKVQLTLEQKQDKALRALAGSLFDGLPSTMRGDTTAQQVYHYLLGAYFGAHETSAVEMSRNKFLNKVTKENSTLVRDAQKVGMEKGLKGDKLKEYIWEKTSNQLNYVPELTPGWDKLSPEVQKSVKEEAANLWGYKSDSRYAGLEVLERILGEEVPEEMLEMPTPEGFEDTGTVRHGDRMVRPIKGTDKVFLGGSGGAEGADAFFSRVGRRYGIDFTHYSFEGHKTSKDAVGYVHKLTEQQLREANLKVEDAAKRLDKSVPREKSYVSKLIKRNYFQVVNSDGIFAVGSIVRKGKKGKDDPPVNEVRGGTGWAIAMAKEMGGREIHVWDTATKGWNKWNRSKKRWEAENTPKLTKDFAGIGTRGKEITVRGKGTGKKVKTDYRLGKDAKKAIEELYENTFGPAPIKSKAEQTKIKKEKQKLATTLGDESKSKAQKQKILAETGIPDENIDSILADVDVEGGAPAKEKIINDPAPKEATQNTDNLKQTSAVPVTDRAVSFVTRELSNLHGGDTRKIYNLSKRVDKVLNKATKRLSYNVDSALEGVKVDFVKEFGINMTPEKTGMMRQYLFLRNHGVQVPQFSVTNNKLNSKKVNGRLVPWPLTRTNAAGNDKRLIAPEMYVSHIWKSYGNKDHGYAMLDHFVRKDKTGRFKEFSFNQYREEFAGKQETFDNIMGEIYNDIEKHHNMYPFGGRGDAERMYLLKYHPRTPLMQNNINTFFKGLPKDAINMSDKEVYVKRYRQNKSLAGGKKTSKRYDRMVISNMLYDAEMNGFEGSIDGVKKLLKLKDRVGKKKGVIDWNKRQQIWFTNGFSADREFFLRKDVQKKYKLGDLSDNKFKFVLMNDADGKKVTGESLAERYTEATDGAIIAEAGFVDAINEGFGMPYSGQNKSFIVSPHSDHGALLGKYMFHKANAEASKWMRDNGVHFIMPVSAAKQYGNRKPLNLKKVVKTGPFWEFNGKRVPKVGESEYKYDIDIADIKGVISEKDTHHQLENQRLPKQMLTNLTDWSFAVKNDPKLRSKVGKDIDSMFEDIVGEHFRGSKEFNKELQDLLDTYSDMDAKTRESKIDRIINNMDKVGVDALIKAMKSPYAQEFTTKAYRKILSKVDEIMMDQMNDGELSRAEGDEYFREAQAFKSGIDRILRLEKKIDNGSLPIFYHKFVRDYRLQAMRNFVVYQVTRPSMPNSISGRMRPYDHWMRADSKFKALNKNDSIFYLDDMYRDMKIDVPEGLIEGKVRTLGELWDIVQAEKKPSAQLKDFFNAVVVRVPMDSLSGAHQLRFAGFTGIKGKGIMLHPRTMRALGGADLDGDKAFAFFGMKKKHRDLYHKNKYEFSTTGDAKGVIKDNKDDFREILTESDPEIVKHFKDPSNMYSPQAREEISMRAADGRARLGPAVINRQSFIAYHSALASSGKTEIVPWRVKIGRNKFKTFDIEFTPRTDEKELNYSRELQRATIAFPSDPLDEAGLKTKEVFEKEVANSLFKIESKQKMPKSIAKKFEKSGMARVLRDSMYGKLKRMNSAYYGRNWTDGRRWYYPEIQDMVQPIYEDFTPEMMNTMLPKMVRELGSVNWTDDPYSRIETNPNRPEYIKNLYDQWDGNVKNLDWLKKQLGRTSFRVTYNPIVKSTLENKLYIPEVRSDIALSEKGFMRAVADTHLPLTMNYPELVKKHWWRVREMENLYRLGQDALIRDMSDMATFQMLNDYIKANNKIPRKTIVTLSKFAQTARRQSTLNFNKRKDVQDADIFDEQNTAFEDQANIDLYIKNFKTGKGKDGKGTNTLGRALTPAEQDILDIMLVGTSDRYQLDVIDAYEKKHFKNLSKHEKQVIAHERQKASGTSMNRAGMNSQAVKDDIIIELLERYSNNLIKTFEVPKETESVTKKKDDKSVEEPIKTKAKDAEGKDVEVELDTNPYSGFEHLKRGEIKDKEFKSLVDMLSDNFNYYRSSLGDNTADRAENINLITRGVVGKDLAAMNKEDYRVLNRFFNDLRAGSWYQRQVVPSRFIIQKDPTLPQKRSYMQFPLAVAKERMQEDFILMHQQGFFENYSGEAKIGKIAKPTHYIERMQWYISHSLDLASRQDEIEKGDLRDRLNRETGYESIPEGEALYEIAVATRELPMITKLKGKIGKGEKVELRDALINFRVKQYQDSYNETVSRHNWDALKNQKFKVELDKSTTMTGKQIVDNINKVITQRNKEIHEGWIASNDKTLAKFQIGHHDKGKLIPQYDMGKFFEHISKQFREGKPLDISEFGLDGLRKISLSMMLQSPYANNKLRRAMMRQHVKDTGVMDFEMYYPHAHMDSAKAAESLKQGLEFIRKSDMDPTSKAAEKKKLLMRHKVLTGDWFPADMLEYENFDGALREIAAGKEGDYMKWFDSNPRTGNMMSRNNHIGGWSKDSGVYEIYQNQLIKTYYRQLAQIMSRQTIETFSENSKLAGKPKDYVRSWENFYKLYAQDAMGNPVNIPEALMKPEAKMNIKGTPYAWWSDSNVKRIVNNVRKKLGMKGDERLPETLRGVDVNDIRHWSNIEARYQMATLLAHPKSAIANIYGGTVHTLQSVGWQNFRNARNVDYLRANLPGEAKNFRSKADLDKWVIGQGVVPDFIRHEAGLNPQFKSGRWKAFIDDAVAVIKNDPNVKDDTLLKVAKRHKISENAFHKAAWFMREPERALRRDSYIAHYLQARQNIGHAEMELNHPFLVEQAKKGVKATQFLYSAPFRPAFSRSALGKVMTRFQLWAWNSVRFRKDIINAANEKGFMEGTVEFDRFKRMAVSDMFVLGMANIFAYSIFENALPAPYNWMQDTADWMFGDEKERDRAFFGAYPTAIAPLQVVTPPIARMGPAAFSAMVNNDWSRVSDYYIWTMFPFGRMFRDVKNSAENPIRTVENMTGIPYGQFHRYIKDLGEEDES